ncbi:MAG: MarR family transcriptional regulator [Candidatus Diapherotrites archaeon]|nr:MarR family transcriptional regulator [Candidatus Diapherotrites archaeon]
MMPKQHISDNMLAVLEVVARRGTGRVTDIAHRLSAHVSSVSANLKRLEEKGLVTKLERGTYEITLRGQLLVDILDKKDMSDEELIKHWAKTVMKPVMKDMMLAARNMENGA